MRLIAALLTLTCWTALTADCGKELSQSVELTEKCLMTLSNTHRKMRIAQNDLARLHADQETLVAEARQAAELEIQTLKQKNALLSKQLESANAQYLALKSEIDQVRDGDSLKSKYATLDNCEVIGEGAYRIPVYLLNVRNESSARGDQVAVYKRGEVVKLLQISKRVVGGREIFWAKTRKGWIYITDSSDKKIRERLVFFMKKNDAGLTSRLAGKPVEGGERT